MLFGKVVKCLKKIKDIDLSDTSYRLDLCDILLFCHDDDRGVDLNGAAYSPLLDSVREDLEGRGFKCVSVAHPFSRLTGRKGYGDPISINRRYFFERIARRFLPSGVIHRSCVAMSSYEKILQITRARLIITIGAPEDLCKAARRRGVFHVELLHGLGYTFLPWGWGGRDLGHLPQGILSLDSVSTSSFLPLADRGIAVKTIPHPFLKRFVQGRPSELPPQWRGMQDSQGGYKKRILISLTWGYAGDHGPHLEYSGIVENGLFPNELTDVIRRSKDVFWYFRFHPVQLRQRKYRHLRQFMSDFVAMNSNCEWRMASHLPFPSVAMNCSGNISMNSMSCYDAAAMGLPSLILCPTVQPQAMHAGKFSDLIKEGYAVKSEPGMLEIESWVRGVARLPPRLSNLNDESSWRDAVDWMLASSGLSTKAETQKNKQAGC